MARQISRRQRQYVPIAKRWAKAEEKVLVALGARQEALGLRSEGIQATRPHFSPLRAANIVAEKRGASRFGAGCFAERKQANVARVRLLLVGQCMPEKLIWDARSLGEDDLDESADDFPRKAARKRRGSA